MPMKKKMDPLTKVKLIYSGELMIFAVVFLVLGILKFTGVLGSNATRLTIFNWITLFGGTWIMIDFVWAVTDKKRQKRISLVDKCVVLPAGIYLITFDLYCLIAKPAIDSNICKYGVPIVFCYLALCYIFEAIYHFKYPVPGLLNAVVEVDDDKVVDEQEAVVLEEDKKEENPQEEESHEQD